LAGTLFRHFLKLRITESCRRCRKMTIPVLHSGHIIGRQRQK
jgi:hypothetical protein